MKILPMPALSVHIMYTARPVNWEYGADDNTDG